jgi:hypothetical protein
MPLPKVTGVVWWRMGRSHYKAIFRRARAGEDNDGYTKDFLQAPLAISDRLRAMLGGGDPPYEPITYLWPNGAFEGGKIYAAEYDYELGRGRLEVGQWTQLGAPAPWQLGNPLADPVITLPGDPDAAIPEAADAQWDQLEDLEPWLMLIQLDNGTDELHLRAYLGAPPADLVDADLAHVPAEVRSHMTGQGGLSGEELPNLWFDPNDLRDPWRLSPVEEAREASRSLAAGGGGLAGVAYRIANESPNSAAPEPFSIDPNERDRATRAHAVTQNALAAVVAGLGREVLSPPGEPSYDLGWVEPDGTFIVAEVKSITARNEERQMRLGLGQVLRYRHVLETTGQPTRALLVTSAVPSDDRWQALCAELGVGLVSPPGLSEALQVWL